VLSGEEGRGQKRVNQQPHHRTMIDGWMDDKWKQETVLCWVPVPSVTMVVN